MISVYFGRNLLEHIPSKLECYICMSLKTLTLCHSLEVFANYVENKYEISSV